MIEMKNKIVTCINNRHAIDTVVLEELEVGKSYKCVDEITLTADNYFKPELASLQGITIKTNVDKCGWRRVCVPKECFRIATTSEIKKYILLRLLNTPFQLLKIAFFKTVRKADRIVRPKYYKKLLQEYENYY